MFPARKLFLAAMILTLLIAIGMPLLAAEAKGKIASVNPEKGQVVLTESVKNWTFQLTKDAQVTVNGRDVKLSELRPGDEAAVTYERVDQKLIASAVRCTRK